MAATTRREPGRGRRPRGRASRGAALVEATAAVPFFIVIFAALLYVGKLYGEKQRTLRTARFDAWTYAMANCKGSTGHTEGDGSNALDDLQDENGDSQGDPNQYNGDQQGSQSFTKDWGTAVATSKSSAAASALIGGYSQDLATTTRVQCNEEPHDGSPSGMLHFAWSALTSW